MEDAFTPVAGAPEAPRDRLEVEDPAALVALVQPLRSRIVRRLVAAPGTAAELAAAFDVPVTRLYYHLDLLVEYGVIEVVATRMRRGVEERRYRAAARDFGLAPSVLDAARERPELLDEVVRAMFESARAEMRGLAARVPIEERETVLLARSTFEVSEERRTSLLRGLRDLIEEYEDDAGEHRVGMLLAAYPLDEPGDVTSA